MPDKEFEPRIKTLVQTLNDMEIPTFESCEGHLSPERPSHPYVDITLEPPICGISPRILFLLSRFIAEWNAYKPEEESWILRPNCYRYSHERGGGPYFLTLEPLEKNNQRNPRILQKHQEKADGLASFLKKKWEEIKYLENSLKSAKGDKK
ncbi:MAG: hypothetical protein WC514_02205 [Candidatus Paceibacterota bacterium]